MGLGGSAHHGGPADVDVLDRVLIAAIGAGHRGCEWVEIHGEQIDGLDAVLAHDVLIHAAAPQQTAVDLRVQRLDPAAHDFREAGVLGHLFQRNAMAYQELGGAARGQQFDAALLQFARELDDSGLVGNTEQCAAYGSLQRTLPGNAELAEFLA